jgi:hypothetical protein
MRFEGKLTTEEALSAISRLQGMVDPLDGKITLVWECTNMKGFDTAAREAWQVFIKNISSKIAAIHLITPNLLIRSGALVIGAFARLKITSWPDFSAYQAQA